jgi:hypothetical protein
MTHRSMRFVLLGFVILSGIVCGTDTVRSPAQGPAGPAADDPPESQALIALPDSALADPPPTPPPTPPPPPPTGGGRDGEEGVDQIPKCKRMTWGELKNRYR